MVRDNGGTTAGLIVLPGQNGPQAVLLLASALTPVHPGAGRTPGMVDLPVARDPLGIPYVPGSMIKGAIKSEIARKKRKIRDDGKVDCSQCKDLCCLLGGEVGEGPEGASAVAFSDLYPLAIPAPVIALPGSTTVFPSLVYVTTAAVLSHISSLAGAANRSDIAEKLANLASEASRAEGDGAAFVGGNGTVKVMLGRSVLTLTRKPQKDIGLDLNGMNTLYQSYPIKERLVVLGDDVGVHVLQELLDRRYRIRLNRLTKTVETGGLWAEEYIPWGTLLVGLILRTGFTNSYCTNEETKKNPLGKLRNLLENEIKKLVAVGGKESTSAGLVRLKIVQRRGGGVGRAG